ncbi:fibronectin type III domain-containing protein [bacterium]|nr:fibronectin type III domain-containing protein [bacterium]
MLLSRLSFIFTLLLLSACSLACGRTSAQYELGHLSVNVSSVGDSQLQTDDLDVLTRPLGDSQYELLIRSSSPSASSALLEASFDPAYRVSAFQAAATQQAQLSLVVTDRPGLLAFGVIMPAGSSLPAGELLRCTISPAGSVRGGAAAPGALGGLVSDLQLQSGAGAPSLDWSYVNLGDYNQDGAVSVADLSQIGIHFQKSGPWDYSAVESVVDGTPDGVISVADLTPIGINYQRKVSGYRIVRSTSEQVSSASETELGSVAFAASTGGTSTRRRFFFELAQSDLLAGTWLAVQPIDSSDSSSGPYSNSVEIVDSADTTPPSWPNAVGIQSALPGSQQVTVAWEAAVDADSPPVNYTVFYQEGGSLDFASAQSMAVAGPALQATVSGLTNGLTYSFAVRASDSAPVPNQESNEVVLSAVPAPGKAFSRPPAGGQQVAEMAGSEPQLVVFQQDSDDADAGAPAVFWLHNDAAPAGNHLYCARFSEGAWQEQQLLAASSYSGLQVLLLGEAEAAPLFHVFTYDQNAGKLLHLRFGLDLALAGSEDVALNPNTAQGLTQLSVDYSAAQDSFGVLAGYSDAASGALRFSQKTGAGNYSTGADIHSGDPVLSASFAFDPAGGLPWLAFSHGTIDTSTTVDFIVSAQYGRYDGSAWTLSDIDYPDSPVQLRLGFKTDGTAMLAFSAVRAITIASISADVLFDAVVGTYNGSGWDYSTVYTASFTPDIQLFTTTITLSEVPSLFWAARDELCLAEIAGNIIISNLSQEISGGQLNIGVLYRTAAQGGFTANTGYFDGEPGLAFDWAAGSGGPAAAYIGAAILDVNELLAGNLGSSGALLYWSAD